MSSMFAFNLVSFSLIILALFALDRLVNAYRGKSAKKNASVARSLLERASAIEGQNPHEATELRQSALAFLSVAR